MSASTAGLGIQNIGQISIIVKDVERATAFYRDVLGLPLLFTVPSMAFFDCGGVRLMLGTASSPEYDHPRSIFYFRVANIQAGYQRLMQHGVEIVSSPRLHRDLHSFPTRLTAYPHRDRNAALDKQD